MSGDNSEEKTLPPSEQKLRKARDKGNVVTSKDTLGSFIAIAALAYLYFRREGLAEQLGALFVLEPADPELIRSFDLILADKVTIVWQLALQLIVPLFALVISLGIFMGMTIAGGPLFAPEALAPKFEKINPAKGIKKVFGRRAMITFLMHVIRMALLIGVFLLVLIGGWSALIRAPLCGFPCAVEAFEAAARPLVFAAIVIMLIMALADYLVQRSEFMREQKMSVSEFKRELKDREGDPHLKGKMQQDQRDMVESPTGAGQATVVIESPGGIAYGIRYVENETPAPLIVARARDTGGVARILKASDAPLFVDGNLVDLFKGKAVGDYVTDDEAIETLAPYLQRAISQGQGE
jgi:type III secretion protein U